MNIRILIAITLFITLTTITSQSKIVFSKFKINKINIENNSLLEEEEIKIIIQNL